MVKRLLTASILILVALAFFILRQVHTVIFDCGVVLVCGLGLFEFMRAFKEDFTVFMMVIAELTVLSMLPVFLFLGFLEVFYLLIGSFVIILISLVFDSKITFKGITLYIFGLIYPLLLMFLFVVLNNTDYGLFFIVLAAIIPVFCDSLALFVGMALKGPKLAPNVSPKKTISGAIGGLFGGVLGAYLVLLLFTYAYPLDYIAVFKVWHVLLLGFVGSIFSELGDLIESSIKRKLEIKDFSNVLPGHGGVLDRLDSLMFSALIVFVFSFFFI